METKRLQRLWARKMGWSQRPVLEVGKAVILGRWGLKTKETGLSWSLASLWEERGRRVTVDMPGDQTETGSSPDYFSFLVLQKAAPLTGRISWHARSWDFKLLRAR